MPSQNSAARNRKLNQDVDRRNAPSNVRKKMSDKSSSSKKGVNGLVFSFVCLVVSMSVLILFFGFYTDTYYGIVDTIAGHFGYSEKQYAVVIDAGSTGSRVLAFEFHRAYLDGRLVLDGEIFRELKPGLSSLTPEEGAKQVNKLLDEARNYIPKELWPKTPLVLKATAGLRMLGSGQADNILNAIKELFDGSGFLVNDESVEIMHGSDEGIFSWFTINFLLGRLNGKNTVAALDLGGGSTQVTYAPTDISQTPLYKDFIHTIPTFYSTVDVFTNSYSGLGLMALRKTVLTGNKENQTSYESECVNPIIKNKPFYYGNKEYLINGKDNKKSTENPEVDYETCYELVKKKALPLVKPKPITISQHQIAAFSYFYDRAIETGLVEPFIGGEISLGEFMKKSREVCKEANADQPFMCVDLIYISVLLQDGYGLKAQTPIKLYKKIRGHEISWALGCAYNVLLNNKGSHL
jgi:ectonucleoside triphosphate diphosphohydrolase 5/6